MLGAGESLSYLYNLSSVLRESLKLHRFLDFVTKPYSVNRKVSCATR